MPHLSGVQKVWNHAECNGSNQRLEVVEEGEWWCNGGQCVLTYISQEPAPHALLLSVIITGHRCVFQNIRKKSYSTQKEWVWGDRYDSPDSNIEWCIYVLRGMWNPQYIWCLCLCELGCVARFVECFPRIYEAYFWSPEPCKQHMITSTGNHRTLWVLGQGSFLLLRTV